jgi:hypothetical protein
LYLASSSIPQDAREMIPMLLRRRPREACVEELAVFTDPHERGSRSKCARAHSVPQLNWPVRICAGASRKCRPDRDRQPKRTDSPRRIRIVPMKSRCRFAQCACCRAPLTLERRRPARADSRQIACRPLSSGKLRTCNQKMWIPSQIPARLIQDGCFTTDLHQPMIFGTQYRVADMCG